MKRISILLFLIRQIILASGFKADSPDPVQANEIEFQVEDKKINVDEELLDEITSNEEFTPASAPQTLVEPLEVTNTFVSIPLDDQMPMSKTPDPIFENETTVLETLPLTYPLVNR